MTVGPKLKQRTAFSCVARFLQYRQKLLNGLFKIDLFLKNAKDELLLYMILNGSGKYEDTVNKELLLHTISFIKNTKLFERSLFGLWFTFYYFYYYYYYYYYFQGNLIWNTAYSLSHPSIPIISLIQHSRLGFARE